MGTFVGHVFVGLSFLFFGIFLAFRFSWRVLNGQRTQYQEGKRNPGLLGALGLIPAEGVMKLLFGTTITLGELFHPPGVNKFHLYNQADPTFQFVHPNEWQHVSMYIFISISGLLDIISQVCLAKRMVLVEQAATNMIFYVSTLVLHFHTHGKTGVENEVHSLMVLTTFLIALILTVEIWKPDYRRLWFTKTYLMILLGSWVLHGAFIIFHPLMGRPYDSNNMSDTMFITTFYCWHLTVDAALLAAIFGLTKTLQMLRMRGLPLQRAKHGVSNGLCQLGWNGVGKDPEELEKLILQVVEDREKGLEEELL
ncbi:transmembrane epididymal protein 1A-like [Ambystoma mexicanum]|uniref:transmembrane epididymal protein 1A-like n=1 Tax=Ambystoma mexicanum TaxID=8296 RepID=UPI0037E8D6A6